MTEMEESNLTKFIWRIENFSSIGDGSLQSPSFRSHSAEWSLKIYPSSDKKYIHLNLQQQNEVKITLNCSFAFSDPNGFPLIWREHKRATNVRVSKNWESIEKINIDMKFIPSEEMFGSMKSKFLFNDALTVECLIWENRDQPLEPLIRLAQTRFEPYPLKPVRQTFVLRSRNVSSSPLYRTLIGVVPNLREGDDSLKVRVNLSDEGEFYAYVTVPQLTIRANIKVSVLDAAKKRHEFADVEFQFDDEIEERIFNTHVTKLLLMTYKNEFLPNDSLSLEIQCLLFFKISFSRLVETEKSFVDNAELIAFSWQPDIMPELKSDQVQPTIRDAPNNVNRTLKNIYEEGFLSDFSLRVQDRIFPVHKAILGASSSVFRDMFTADTKETESNSVDIPNVDADTMQRMLKFVYCDLVEEDLQWGSACSLYAAADKYALEPLKQRCSEFLVSELTASNVLGVLWLADAHQDEDMRHAALDFILEHDKEVIGSEIWRKLAEKFSKLAFDALQRVYLKKIGG